MEILIRPATRNDCKDMIHLIRELAEYERAPGEVTVDQSHFEESGFGDKPVWWAFVAESISTTENPRIVGFALYYIRYSTWKGQRMYLEDILVTQSMRGKGIGAMLFDKLLDTCRLKNLNGMTWQVLEWNEPAINFYKKYPGVKFDPEWVNCSLDLK